MKMNSETRYFGCFEFNFNTNNSSLFFFFWSTCAVVGLHAQFCHFVYTLIRSHSGQINCILQGSFSILPSKWGVSQFVNIHCVDKAICESPVKYTPVNLSPRLEIIRQFDVTSRWSKCHMYYQLAINTTYIICKASLCPQVVSVSC